MGRMFRSAVEAAGLPPMRFHDLRKVWASNLHRAGISLVDIQHFGGWGSLAMVSRYCGSAPADAVDRARASLDAYKASAPQRGAQAAG